MYPFKSVDVDEKTGIVTACLKRGGARGDRIVLHPGVEYKTTRTGRTAPQHGAATFVGYAGRFAGDHLIEIKTPGRNKRSIRLEHFIHNYACRQPTRLQKIVAPVVTPLPAISPAPISVGVSKRASIEAAIATIEAGLDFLKRALLADKPKDAAAE